jgi:parallel beta-helix repeat protein
MYDEYGVLETNQVDNGLYLYSAGSQTINNNIIYHTDSAGIYSAESVW